MAPTDLLDMFKQRPAKGSSPARATSRSRDGSHGSQRGAGGGPELKKRLLGGSVLLLLMALAFTAGIGVGQRRRPAVVEPTPLAARVVEYWGLRGKALPNTGLKADDLKTRVVGELVRRWPELSNHTYVVDLKDKNGKPTTQFRLVLKGFTSREDAQAFAAELGVWAVEGYLPFTECRPERMPL